LVNHHRKPTLPNSIFFLQICRCPYQVIEFISSNCFSNRISPTEWLYRNQNYRKSVMFLGTYCRKCQVFQSHIGTKYDITSQVRRRYGAVYGRSSRGLLHYGAIVVLLRLTYVVVFKPLYPPYTSFAAIRYFDRRPRGSHRVGGGY